MFLTYIICKINRYTQFLGCLMEDKVNNLYRNHIKDDKEKRKEGLIIRKDKRVT